jgi:mxaA protein
MTPLIRASLIASLLLAQGAFAQTPTAAAPDAPAASSEGSPAAQEAPAADSSENGAPATPTPDAAAPASAAPPLPHGAPARVEQPRAFGHTLGDLLTQRVLLAIDGKPVELGKPPAPGRVGVWLERRPTRVERDADGRRWLVIEHQLINAPQALTALTLPALDLPTSGGLLGVPAWPFSAAPLTPRNAFARGALDTLQPDRAAPAVDTASIRRQIALWGGLCVATLLAWGGWLGWRSWRADRQQPFARALRELNGLRGRSDDAPEAWQALHRAFDRTAGRSLQAASLARLFERAPQYAPLRADIERFYAQSATLFFGDGQPADALPLRSFARRLRSIEKRHEA